MPWLFAMRLILHRELLLAVLACMVFGCSTPPDGDPPIASQPPVCVGGLGVASVKIEPRFETIGPSSNTILRFGQQIWIVESGSNTLSRLVLDDESFDGSWIDVGNDRNPYDVTMNAQFIAVTNYLGQSVSIFERQSGKFVREIKHESLKNPSGVAIWDGRLYVSNVHFLNNIEGYGQASVSIFDLQMGTFVGNIRLQERNAQFLDVLELDGQSVLVVVNTGSILFDQQGAQVGSPGSLELWYPTDDVLNPERQRHVLPLNDADRRIGGPGRPMLASDGGAIYLSSATSPVLFKLDLTTKTWSHGSKNPLRFAPPAGDALHHAQIGPRGLIWITSFNEDALYIWDTRCDKLLAGPLPLGVDERMLEGPHGLAIDPNADGVTLYYIMSLSNTLGRVTVRYLEPTP